MYVIVHVLCTLVLCVLCSDVHALCTCVYCYTCIVYTNVHVLCTLLYTHYCTHPLCILHTGGRRGIVVGGVDMLRHIRGGHIKVSCCHTMSTVLPIG